jgi:hypothetical protein
VKDFSALITESFTFSSKTMRLTGKASNSEVKVWNVVCVDPSDIPFNEFLFTKVFAVDLAGILILFVCPHNIKGAYSLPVPFVAFKVGTIPSLTHL